RLLADLGRHQESMTELDKAARLATGEAAAGGGGSLIRIALPNRIAGPEPLSAEEMRALRELAVLLERTSRMDALERLLNDAEELGVSRETLGYPAAVNALRGGDPIEARRLLELESNEIDPVRWHRLMAQILDASGDTAAAVAAEAPRNRS